MGEKEITVCYPQNMFGHISRELDLRHDKKERIVKISRDITIGVKFDIFPSRCFQTFCFREQEDHLCFAPDQDRG